MLHTAIYRKLNGELVGRDFNGNLYYQERFPLYSKQKKRWVIYKDGSRDGSYIPASWHGWIHYLSDEVPEVAFYDYNSKQAESMRQSMNTRNRTGTHDAYSALSSGEKITTYTPWKPD